MLRGKIGISSQLSSASPHAPTRFESKAKSNFIDQQRLTLTVCADRLLSHLPRDDRATTFLRLSLSLARSLFVVAIEHNAGTFGLT